MDGDPRPGGIEAQFPRPNVNVRRAACGRGHTVRGSRKIGSAHDVLAAVIVR